jgi:hypothetical protein
MLIWIMEKSAPSLFGCHEKERRQPMSARPENDPSCRCAIAAG